MQVYKRLLTCCQCQTVFERKGAAKKYYCTRDCKIKHNIIPDNNGCWNWQGNLSPIGYGQFSWDLKTTTAHRHSYLEYNGELLDNEVVRHTCTNKKCCNPKHLLKGTQQDNHQDRYVYDDNFPLSRAQVLEIVKDHKTGLTDQEVSDKYSISLLTATNIRLGRTYQPWTLYAVQPRRCRYPKGSNNLAGRPKMTATHNGVTKPVVEWAVDLNMGADTIRRRLKNGETLGSIAANTRKPYDKSNRPLQKRYTRPRV